MRHKPFRHIARVGLSLLLAAALCGLSGCGRHSGTPKQSSDSADAPTLHAETAAVPDFSAGVVFEPTLSSQESSEISEALSQVVEFTLEVTGADGVTESQIISTDCQTVGEALLSYGMIDGDEGPYGLYVKTVLGETHDYEKDGMYWAFYVDGSYASAGVDSTLIVPGSVYALRAER